jgi:hypothetical protein
MVFWSVLIALYKLVEIVISGGLCTITFAAVHLAHEHTQSPPSIM